MNYFDLVNKCLVELNYKQVNSFNELTKNDHKKIKNILRLLNTEICNYENWDFRLRKTELKLPANTNTIPNSVNGKIASIIVDGHVFKYQNDTDKIHLTKSLSNSYSIFNNTIILPSFNTDKTLNIIYYTSNTTIDSNNTEKLELELEDDKTIIPQVFAEPLLIYGTCLRLKANPQHVKFSYWLSMYNQAFANMKSKISPYANYYPQVKMHRY